MSKTAKRLRLRGDGANHGAPTKESTMNGETLQSVTIPATSSRPRGGRRILRRIGAVLAGLVAIFAVTSVTDAIMHAIGVFPPVGAPAMSSTLFLFAFAYRFVFDVAGSYLTARLAPDRPMRHALVLGAIGLVLSIAGAVAMWDAGPAWYPIGLAASALPCAWLGARLHEHRGRV
jgi:hypothetical protein